MQRLEAKMTEDEVKAYVEEEVMTQLLVLLRAVPAGDIGKRGSASDPLQQVLGFCAGVLRASDHNALLERITSNLKLVQGLVQTEDMEVLSSSVSELKQRCQAFAGQSEERERDDALAFFFLQAQSWSHFESFCGGEDSERGEGSGFGCRLECAAGSVGRAQEKTSVGD